MISCDKICRGVTKLGYTDILVVNNEILMSTYSMQNVQNFQKTRVPRPETKRRVLSSVVVSHGV